MSQHPFSISQATGDEILPIVDRIRAALDGESYPNATMALLFAIFTISYPEISNEDLARGIKDASQHICLLLDSYENPVGPSLPNSKIN